LWLCDLFNLAKQLGLEAEKSAPVNPTALDSTSEHDCQLNKALPINRHFRQVEIEEIQHSEVNAANDSSLPNNYFRAENLTFCKTPPNVVERLRYKYSDAAWILAKLRRVPGNQRQALINEYSTIYEYARNAEENAVKKDNRARFIANSWLLKATQ